MSSDPATRRAFAALALLSLIWGYNWVVMKEVLRYTDPFDFTAIRTLLGAASLFVVMLIRGTDMRPVAIRDTILLGLVQTGIFTALIQTALVTGGAGKTAVLVYAMPFWLLPLAWLLLGERIRGLQWPAIVLAAAGLILIVEPWSLHGSPVGTALALAGGIAWACSAIMVKRLRAKHNVELLPLTAWQMLFGALALTIVALLHPSEATRFTPYYFGALAFNALLGTGLAWLLWLYILQHLPAGLAGLSTLIVPGVGVMAAWIQLGERPSFPEAVGMGLIGCALALLSVQSLGRAPVRR